ncbi:unnamed protein product [Adineta steineri]|uniref:SnoaL-like domain-containing protein n=1 Tax=Adineta steineri TaxID=433720 RepID=A0A814AW78_9BILA|nr:unnamed protein product [Adineta steineri]CAF0782389.1 unnamed protein product [Adineta steineri]CAF0830088.1 unnamed protein product [Adineta steineri]CAF0918353.1 unnamed protein product [Adineta steineri]CAF0983196.1 unnamed protein product [Adineta steineri]
MVLSAGLTNEQIEASKTWVYDFYKAFDSLDLDRWLPEFHKADITLNLGNLPTMKGLEAMHEHFERQNPQLLSMRHTMKNIDVFADHIYAQNEATFIVKNDPEHKEIKIQAICLFWKNINEKKASAIDVYFDPSALIERIQMFLQINA